MTDIQGNQHSNSQEQPVKVKVSLKNLFIGLFIYPHRILPLLLMDKRIFRPWLIFTVVFMLVSIILVSFLTPTIYQNIAIECDELAIVCGNVEIENTPKNKNNKHFTIKFSEIKEYPKIFSFTTIPLDLILENEGKSFVFDAQKKDDRWHLWFNGDIFNFYAQDKIIGHDNFPTITEIIEKQFPDINSNVVFSREEVAIFFKNNFKVLIPFSLLFVQFLNYIVILGMGLIFVVFTHLLWRRGIHNLILFFYAGITALIPALVYSLLPGMGIEHFVQIFSWSMAIYLTLVIISMRILFINQETDRK